MDFGDVMRGIRWVENWTMMGNGFPGFREAYPSALARERRDDWKEAVLDRGVPPQSFNVEVTGHFFYLPRVVRWCRQYLSQIQPSGRVFVRVPGLHTEHLAIKFVRWIYLDLSRGRTVALVLVRGLQTGYSQWPPGQPRTLLSLFFSPLLRRLLLPPLSPRLMR